MNQPNNKRHQDTVKRVQEAMLELLDERDFERVTVQDVCLRAEINRSTFYRHYVDIYDLMAQLERQIQSGIVRQWTSAGDGNPSEPISQAALCRLLTYIQEHRSFYKAYLREYPNRNHQAEMQRIFDGYLQPLFENYGVLSKKRMAESLKGEILMNESLRKDAERIARGAIAAVSPEAAVRRALAGKSFPGRLYLVSVGKAAWKMAEMAVSCLTQPLENGIVVTKYDHVEHPIPGVICYEAGHPVPDENTFKATQAVLDMTADLSETDTVLFLLSGGGSALFEKPLISGAELQDITGQLLASGADIVEMNTIRKRLSGVKGGRFAQWCSPAHVEAIVLSDILGDPLDMIASGPAAPDKSTCADAVSIAEKYCLKLTAETKDLLHQETPKELNNVSTQIIGSVRELCRAAGEIAKELGYEPILLTDHLDCEAKEAGAFLADILRTHAGDGKKLAYLAGGETVVHLIGKGLGGRNQELALSAAAGLDGISNACVISVGSDGTDGPTDAAGGYADGDTAKELAAQGLTVAGVLAQNDAYHALKAVDGLIVTGPTGTNVNDVAVALIG